MKKIVVLLLSALLLTSCSGSKLPNIDISQIVRSEDTYTEISVEEFEALLASGENFIFYVGQSSCAACIAFKPIVGQFVEKTGIPVYYIDASFSFETEKDVLNFYKKYFNITDPRTPTVGLVIDKKVVQVFDDSKIMTLDQLIEAANKLK